MSSNIDPISVIAQEYYDSDDAYNFYQQIWGGSFIHVGIYDTDEVVALTDPADKVKRASEKSCEHLFKISQPIPSSLRLLDMGSGYGGNARYCAKNFGCSVVCIDISRKHNDLNKIISTDCGLGDKIIIPGERSFFETGEPSSSIDIVFSMDSLLHAGSMRDKAIEEVSRVLKPGGLFVFTDIMQADNANVKELQAVYKRLHLEDMGSPSKYTEWASKNGMTLVNFEDRTSNLTSHYGSINELLQAKRCILVNVSSTYIDRTIVGLNAWVEEASKKNISWGFFIFKKI